ncbi:MAG: hypothetical protein ABIO62_06050, partial [Paracoccaceae bacterium]
FFASQFRHENADTVPRLRYQTEQTAREKAENEQQRLLALNDTLTATITDLIQRLGIVQTDREHLRAWNESLVAVNLALRQQVADLQRRLAAAKSDPLETYLAAVAEQREKLLKTLRDKPERCKRQLNLGVTMPNPFGIPLGSTPQLESATYQVSFKHVPNPHPDLTTYAGTWSPNGGMNFVVGCSKPFPDDPSGSAAVLVYDRLKRQLQKIYGPSQSFESVSPDAIYTDDREFVAGLGNHDRSHSHVWTPMTGANLDAEIDYICLEIAFVDQNTAKVILIYSSEDTGEGEKEYDQIGISAL